MPFYAVAIGERPGIYGTWPECERLVKGYPNARYKKFNSRDEAQQFINSHSSVHAGGGGAGRKREREDDNSCDLCQAPPLRQPQPPSLPHPPSFTNKQLYQREGALVCFTDGSCLNNGTSRARGGWAAIWPYHESLSSSGPLSGTNQTNNRAEYRAALEALRGANLQDPQAQETLFICTDSQLLINSMTKWLQSWRRNNWVKSDGQPVLNRDLLEDIIKEKGGRRVEWIKIEAHTNRKDWDSYWNDCADQRCKQAAGSQR